jgi:hypothetical protein
LLLLISYTPSSDLIVHYMMSYSWLIVTGAAPYCHASHHRCFPSPSVFFISRKL